MDPSGTAHMPGGHAAPPQQRQVHVVALRLVMSEAANLRFHAAAMINWPQGPQEEVLSCRDTLSLVLPAEESQAALTRLFLISRLWAEAARSLDCWREIKWEAVSRRAAACRRRPMHPSSFLPTPCLQASFCDCNTRHQDIDTKRCCLLVVSKTLARHPALPVLCL